MDTSAIEDADMNVSEEELFTLTESEEEEAPKADDFEEYDESKKRKGEGGKNFVNNKFIHLIYGKRDIIDSEDKELHKKYRKARKAGFRKGDTFKTHIPKEQYIAWMKKKCQGKKIKLEFIALAHESADKKAPYYHTHVICKFSKPFASECSDIFDYEMDYPDKGDKRFMEVSLHPCLKYVTSAKHFDRLKHYLAKEDPENAHLKHKEAPHWLDVLEGCKDEKEALRKCAKTPNQVGGIMLAYNTLNKMKAPVSPYQYNEFFDWQTQCHQRAIEGVNYQATYKVDMSLPAKLRKNHYDRKWIVIYNPEFGAGKSKLALSLAALDPRNVWASQELSKGRDLASQLKGYLKHGTAKTMIVNITADGGRDLLKPVNQKEFRTSCEKLTDGWIMSEKYEGSPEIWKAANLFIFTNYMPKLGGCDPERWEIYHVKDVESPMRLMNLSDARACYKEEKASHRPASVDDSMYDKRFPGLWHPPRPEHKGTSIQSVLDAIVTEKPHLAKNIDRSI